MSIYVRVGDETICVSGPGGDAGEFASSEPIPVEVLEREVACSRVRQGLSGGLVAGRAEGALSATDELAPMIRGLARAAARLDLLEPTAAWISELWDDECREALEEARLRGLAPLRGSGANMETAQDPRAGVFSGLGTHGELYMRCWSAWRRWAETLLKEDAKFGSVVEADDVLRKKIAAVLEAPSVIPTDFVPREPGDPALEACARVGHEVYRAGMGNPDMPGWDDAPESDRAEARAAASGALSGVPPREWFERWRARMAADGWSAGPVVDEARKQHPNLQVATYEELPEEQRALDQLFVAAVLAVAVAVDGLEDACSAPVLKVRGDASSEQFDAFKRDWERRVAAAPGAWKTPIVDAPEVVVRRPPSPYTRSGVVSFVDRLVDTMLGAPLIWGSFRELELQALLLLEVRAFVVAGQPGADATTQAYAKFVVDLLGDAASTEPLSSQLEALGRAGEFVARMGEFVASWRLSVGWAGGL